MTEHIISFTSPQHSLHVSVSSPHFSRLTEQCPTELPISTESWEGASSIACVGYEEGVNSLICYFSFTEFRALTYSYVTAILCTPITSKTFLIHWSCECALSSNFFRAHSKDFCVTDEKKKQPAKPFS